MANYHWWWWPKRKCSTWRNATQEYECKWRVTYVNGCLSADNLRSERIQIFNILQIKSEIRTYFTPLSMVDQKHLVHQRYIQRKDTTRGDMIFMIFATTIDATPWTAKTIKRMECSIRSTCKSIPSIDRPQPSPEHITTWCASREGDKISSIHHVKQPPRTKPTMSVISVQLTTRRGACNTY